MTGASDAPFLNRGFSDDDATHRAPSGSGPPPSTSWGWGELGKLVRCACLTSIWMPGRMFSSF